MLDSRLSKILSDLSGPELTRLEKLIASPYHNTHPLVTQLFQLLLAPLREGEPLVNVPRAVTDHGHQILSLERLSGDIFELVIVKNGS